MPYSAAAEPQTVTTTPEGDPAEHSIAALADGRFILCWQKGDIGYYQLLDAGGAKIGDELQLVEPRGRSILPDVAALDGGGFVLIWTCFLQEGSSEQVYRGQVYGADGAPVGPRFQQPGTHIWDTGAKVVAVDGGGFVVVFGGPPSPDHPFTGTTYNQAYDAAGAATGDPVAAGPWFRPQVARLEGGGFVVVDEIASDTEIHARIFADDGSSVSGVIVAATAESGQTIQMPCVATLADGGFLVLWQDSNGIEAQVFNATGTKVGAQWSIDGVVGGQEVHSVHALENGDFVIAVTRGINVGIEAHVYAADGTSLGDPVTVAGAGAFDVEVTALAGGGFAVAFDADGELLVRTFVPAWAAEQSGTTGSDALTAGVEATRLDGLAGNDGLTDGAANDYLLGGAGNDILNVSGGDDFVHGGDGVDTVSYARANAAVTVDLALTAAQDIGGGGTDTLRDLENVVGSAWADQLFGTDAANSLSGGNGNDLMDGRAGADTMTGGLGNDTYVVDNSGDVIVELAGQGNDTVEASVSFTLAGTNLEHLILTGLGNVNATGNAGANNLYGNAGNNRIDGGMGADRMSGGDGDDIYYVDNVGDRVLESSATGGIDTVWSAIDFTLAYQQLERLFLTGAALNATGNGLANTLVGTSAANVLDGWAAST